MALRDDVLANYHEVLREEIHDVGRRLPRKTTVSRMHWGGGTPALMRPHHLSSILTTLSEYFVFADGFEHAIELDPRGVTADLAHSLADLGVNRVSLGVQDLDEDVQRAIGRVQPFSVVSSAFAALRRAGIDQLNVDLIHGLPLQTTASVARTAAAVAAFGANRVACYGYAHLPKRKRNQRLIDEALLPGAAERYAQARIVSATFTDRGYEAIGIDHFARPDDALAVAAREGRLHRNFQGYTDDASPNLIGFGASAISQFDAGLVQNIVDPTAYANAIRRGQSAAVRGLALTPDDRKRSVIIESLMCAFHVDLTPFGGADAFSEELARLRPLVADGIVSERRGVVALTPVGRPFARVVAAVFDAYRQPSSSGFSLAV